jgi:hypothetical protein
MLLAGCLCVWLEDLTIISFDRFLSPQKLFPENMANGINDNIMIVCSSIK